MRLDEAGETVVRDRRFGRGKFHLPTDPTLTSTLCGRTPSGVGPFTLLGERAAFGEHCPHRICKLCLKAEGAQGG